MTLHAARSFAFVAGVLLLSACSGNGTGSTQRANPAMPGGPSAAGTHERSWMANDADTLDLLYVSSAKDGGVYAYSYPQGALKGWLLDRRAGGLCSDRDGDVFVPEGGQILEYNHGGTQPLAVLHNPLGGAPQFCAVDPSTGNLALSAGTPGKSGIAIYTNAQGSAKATTGALPGIGRSPMTMRAICTPKRSTPVSTAPVYSCCARAPPTFTKLHGRERIRVPVRCNGTASIWRLRIRAAARNRRPSCDTTLANGKRP